MQTDFRRLAAAAMRAHRAGDFVTAEDLTRSALASNPDYGPSLVHLSVLLRHRGRFLESADTAVRAIEADPTAVDGYVQLGLSKLGQGCPGDAAEAFERAAAINPGLAPVHYHLGLAYENLGRKGEAREAFLQATRLSPQDARARLSLGALLLGEEDEVGAMAQANAAIGADRNCAAAYLLKAKVLVAQGRGADAEVSIRRSLAMDPAASFGHTMLGFRLLQTGHFAEAEREFLRSLDLDAAQGVAFFGITQARKISEADRPLVRRMEDTLAETPLTYAEAGYLHFALAKSMDNLGEFEDAMAHYDEAHRNARLAQYGTESFDGAAYAAEFEAIERLYTRERMERPPTGIDSNLPILIVGMMRSGTTLTEQILSSHPEIGAAGEQVFWAKRGHLAEDLTAGRFDEKQAQTLAREYCRTLRQAAPGMSHITDKLPGNYTRLGMLHLAMPNAKIVHCRRNPVDTALSVYITPNPVAPLFSHSKEGIVTAYRSYLRLMEHWRAILPADRFHEIRYEELVASPEKVIRGLLDFLELPWDDACLRHDQNAKEVKTPSLWQVRQPMYGSSVGRWKRYEPWLGALGDLVSVEA